MEQKPEQKIGLGMEKVAERELLSQPFSRYLMEDWCRINSYVELDVLERAQWEKEYKEQPISLEGERKVLHVPRDMKFYEMPKITGKVALDVYEGDPQMQEQWQEKLKEYGENFRNAGVYIAKRADSLGGSQAIAERTAEEFFDYGEKALGEQTIRPLSEDGKEWQKIIAQIPLSDQETKHLDKWLAGDDLYKKRMAAIEALPPELKDEALEVKRLETLAQYFRLVEKGGGQNAEKFSSKEAPSIAQRFYAKAKNNLGREVERAYQDLEMAIHEGGYKGLLKKELAEIGGNNSDTASVLSFYNERLEPLKDMIDVPAQREMLKRSAKMQDSELGEKELFIASKIQRLIGSLEYKSESDFPSKILKNEAINCLGKAAIFCQLMKEIGIDHAVIRREGHIASIISTKDGRVFLAENTDPFTPLKIFEIEDSDIVGTKSDGSRVGLSDIRAIASGDEKNGVNFRIGQQFWHVAPSDTGLLAAIDNNLSTNVGTRQETEALMQRATEYDPKDPYYAKLLTSILRGNKGGENATKILAEKVVSFGRDAQALVILGDACGDLGRYRQAQEVLEKAIEQDPNNQAAVFNLAKQYDTLGDLAKASEHYKSFVHGQRMGNSQWYDDAGKFFMSTGENDEAKIAYEISLLEAPNEVSREKARMKLSEIAESEGDIITAQGLRLRNAVNRVDNLFRRNNNEQG